MPAQKVLLSATILAAFLCVPQLMPAQTLTPIANFNGPNGNNPIGGVIQGRDGNFYGTTIDGGANDTCSEVGCGTVFRMAPDGAITTLYNFCGQTNCVDGAMPNGLVQGSDGNFYGTTVNGGTHNLPSCGGFGCGTVFRLTPTGMLTVLYSFCAETNCTDGAAPDSSLVEGRDGNFYGVTYHGGTTCAVNGLCGTVFKITPTGTLTTLYSFCSQTNCSDGSTPEGTLVQATDGDFYGTTLTGGNSGCTFFSSTCGTIFKITSTGTLSTLYRFCSRGGCADGSSPLAGMVQATDGNFYGTASFGGSNCNAGGGCGVIYKITAAGAYTTLYTFCRQTNCTDGENPFGGLMQAADGNLYGTTSYGGINPNDGTVFKITPTGTFATLHLFCSLENCLDGARPVATMVQGSDGNLYGTTDFGGTSDDGTVFRLTPPRRCAVCANAE